MMRRICFCQVSTRACTAGHAKHGTHESNVTSTDDAVATNVNRPTAHAPHDNHSNHNNNNNNSSSSSSNNNNDDLSLIHI